MVVSSQHYGWLARALHWFALEQLFVQRVAFDLDCDLTLPPAPPEGWLGKGPGDRPVYICGLARSGTTLLLELLAQMPEFRSQTYRDMPFVLAPNLWAKLRGNRAPKAALAERAHGDGVLVGYDSVESFEEVFWRVFAPAKNQDPKCHNSGGLTPEVMAQFANFRAIVANPKAKPKLPAWRRYLSKNNANLLRLDALLADETAVVLLAFRDPIATARSLFQQHQSFLAAGDDRFVQRYMGWLGHFEFGPDHRPLAIALSGMNPQLAPNDPNYWLDYWLAIYRFVLSKLAQAPTARLVLVGHDTLRADPAAGVARLLAAVDAAPAAPQTLASQLRKATPNAPPHEFQSDLVAQCDAVYSALLAHEAGQSWPPVTLERSHV